MFLSLRVLAYSCVTPGYDEKVDDGRLYVTPPKEICERFNNTRMIARMVKALPHLFLDTKNIDACLWIDSSINFANGYSAKMLVAEYFLDTQHCGVFAHTERTTIDQEVLAVNSRQLDYPSLTARHKGGKGKLAWTGIVYRRFTSDVIKANNEWWAEISTKSSRDQLSFPYVFGDLVDYKASPDLEELGPLCWIKNSRWSKAKHLQKQNY